MLANLGKWTCMVTSYSVVDLGLKFRGERGVLGVPTIRPEVRCAPAPGALVGPTPAPTMKLLLKQWYKGTIGIGTQ